MEKLSSAGKIFSWPWLTAKAPSTSSVLSPHLDRWKADPNLQDSDGQNFCNWESATPHSKQNTAKPTWQDLFKNPYSTSIFYSTLPRNCDPWCIDLQPTKIQLLRRANVKARQAIPHAEHPLLHFIVAMEDALKRKLLQLQGFIQKVLMHILNSGCTEILRGWGCPSALCCSNWEGVT